LFFVHGCDEKPRIARIKKTSDMCRQIL